jgi:ABC-type Fe3+-siderophore transport system permease subunit
MQNWRLLIVIVGVLATNLPAVSAQWRTDRPGFIKTLWLMGIYALYVALGIVLLLLLAPRQPDETKALYLTGVMVGWIFYGVLSLMRLVPRYREPPRWLMRWRCRSPGARPMFGCLGAYLWAPTDVR